ncbi:hypothetical protein HPP92_019150 [Vanilla planifolia]|uniref:Jacalin-type lectin domain-containing protein n=1 Tax=Vanilla planifolia TaxID=51239 RepID=A0A835Q6E0_VANPL|nr:hypothetical protein HPP92_019150 [Vanilla planifolia]
MAFEKDGQIYIRLKERGCQNSSDKSWDDGATGRIKHIFIWHDKYERIIHGIQTTYERKGEVVISKMHGGNQGNFETITPNKPLTWMSGYYGSYCVERELFVDEEEAPWNYYKVITSLKFGNQEESYGPFGFDDGTPFFFRGNTEIVGFHGSSNDEYFGYVSTIGLYIKTGAVAILGNTSSASTTQIGSLDDDEAEEKSVASSKS